jgi:hypothetical protein
MRNLNLNNILFNPYILIQSNNTSNENNKII